jgi:hypothetical protein
MTIIDILTPYGFTYFGDCFCSGDYWHKFKSALYPATEIWVTPNRPDLRPANVDMTFRIYLQDELQIERPVTELEDTLEKNKGLMF